MDELTVTISEHALDRIQERTKTPYSKMLERVKKLWCSGKRPIDVKNEAVKKYALREEAGLSDGREIRVSGDKIYVFYSNSARTEVVLVTVFIIPKRYMKS